MYGAESSLDCNQLPVGRKLELCCVKLANLLADVELVDLP